MGKSGGGWFSPVRANKAALANAQSTTKAANATLNKALVAETAAVALVERCKTADSDLDNATRAVGAARMGLKRAQNMLTNAAGHKAAANTRKLANVAAAAKKANENRIARKAEYAANAERSAQRRAFPGNLPPSSNNNMPALEPMQYGGKRKTRKSKTRKSWW